MSRRQQRNNQRKGEYLASKKANGRPSSTKGPISIQVPPHAPAPVYSNPNPGTLDHFQYFKECMADNQRLAVEKQHYINECRCLKEKVRGLEQQNQFLEERTRVAEERARTAEEKNYTQFREPAREKRKKRRRPKDVGSPIEQGKRCPEVTLKQPWGTHDTVKNRNHEWGKKRAENLGTKVLSASEKAMIRPGRKNEPFRLKYRKNPKKNSAVLESIEGIEALSIQQMEII